MVKIRTSRVGKTINHQTGFTYIMVLLAVVVLGIVAGAANVTTRYVVKTDREAELLFRGQAYRDAIGRYYQAGKEQKTYPKNLDDLLNDPRFPEKHHLRTLYPDPMTQDGTWTLLLGSKGGIKGVASQSTDESIKQANFPLGLEHLEGRGSYDQWHFVYEPPKKPAKKPDSGI